eukprot:scaffold429087_cov40-Prasinocladus_malaysianus.AAC.1
MGWNGNRMNGPVRHLLEAVPVDHQRQGEVVRKLEMKVQVLLVGQESRDLRQGDQVLAEVALLPGDVRVCALAVYVHGVAQQGQHALDGGLEGPELVLLGHRLGVQQLQGVAHD